MTPTISTAGLTCRYTDQLALDDVSVDVQPGSITGLLGRNGAGKSTFMKVVTAQEFAGSGTVRVFGQNPVENDSVLRHTAFVREDQQFPEITAAQALRAASWFFPNWDTEFAETLIADFGLPVNRRIRKLSRGMRSALSITLGLAARAELTLFDEPYAGLDSVARQLFYDHLLTDFMAHPRTVLLSTHLIDEAADLLEKVILIDRGRIVLDADAEAARGSAITVSGPTSAVEAFVAGREIWHRRGIGNRSAVTITGPLDASGRAAATAAGLTVESLSLQQLLVHASQGDTSRGDTERASA